MNNQLVTQTIVLSAFDFTASINFLKKLHGSIELLHSFKTRFLGVGPHPLTFQTLVVLF